MRIELTTPSVGDLPALASALDGWQPDDVALQLHAGDLGWHTRLGAAATAAALRVWRADGAAAAIGLLDGPGLARLGVAPALADDAALAARVADDLHDPDAGMLPAGDAAVEARLAPALHAALARLGWVEDDPWTPLVRDLAAPVEPHGLALEVVDGETSRDGFGAVVAAAFGTRPAPERWTALAASPLASRATSLLARVDGAPAAAVTVWSAGEGRQGILEPMGVDPAFRGRGLGRAIVLAAADALRSQGASSAAVATETANVGGVAAYRSAGFRALPESRDLLRP
ncbi:GNAT family N-acetyltransferase [Agrococcus sp. SL85]|uniref:GNAT family N-acetyltransferase n=1 Tax=Agrococcus sp. SL85 TaxID=2995141 RepID=UPI00226D1864|nr:GNAT family N-acetyltransferase [Agrococcus sp. SL85]WAC66390.1 GNAT family N-acetyltransferase [Agrococcus sp. SL85]